MYTPEANPNADMNRFYDAFGYFSGQTDDVCKFVKLMRPYYKFFEWKDPADVEDYLYEAFSESKANEV